MKQLIPLSTRRSLRLIQRWLRYQRLGYRFAQPRKGIINIKSVVSIEQEVKKSHLFQNKLHNLRLSGTQVANYVVRPGEIFSFWRAVGRPVVANGYKKGRNIVNGQLQEGIGGGLCQLSGLIYHLALLTNLEVLERHHHSLDLYDDASRYAPIGTDATVVYGYKDLLIKNNTHHNIQFRCQLNKHNRITGELAASGPLKERQLNTEIQQQADLISVKLFDEQNNLVSESTYRQYHTQ